MRKLIFAIVILLPIGVIAQQNTFKQMIYKNNEIEINFQGTYKLDDGKEYLKQGYFSKSTKHIKFCEVKPQPEYVQQVHSEDGYLCSMYILPLLNELKLEKEVKEAFAPKKALASLSEVESVSINEHTVLKWRYRIGKTRLDHYMLKTKDNYYLFISSPYGSNGYIEKIIGTVKFLK